MALFRMPSLGADMEAATLVDWRVAPGDAVRRGDVVAVVETQKGAIEVEIFLSGTVTRLIAREGDEAEVGAPLAEIASQDEAAEAPAPPAETTPEPTPKGDRAPAAGRSAVERPPATDIAASPAARAAAAGLGVDLAQLPGSGPGGAVVLADVEAAARRAAPPSGEAPRKGLDLTAMRAAIAAAMTKSAREIPHHHLSREIDLQAAADWLGARNAERPAQARLLMGALLLKAAARAARDVPEVNGWFLDGAHRRSEAVHAGVAVALRGGGLIAPAIHDADALPLDDLMAKLRDLVGRARAGRLRSSEVTDATITVSSLGEDGADALFGLIYPPQVALAGFGAPRRRVVAVGDAIAARLTVLATLAADHRVSDGRRGGRFLAAVDQLLQTPEEL